MGQIRQGESFLKDSDAFEGALVLFGPDPALILALDEDGETRRIWKGA